MPLSTTGRNNLLTDGLATKFTHVSLHSGDATAGANELTGGSPAYARKAVTWAAAAAGVRDNTAGLTFDVPAGITVLYGGLWDALTVGNFQGYFGIGSTLRGVASVEAGTDTLASNGHGLSNDHRVFVFAVTGEAIPTGLAAGTLYFVVGSAADTFQLSLTSGGAAVNVTADGELAFARTVPEVFGSQGTLTIDTGNLDVDATAI